MEKREEDEEEDKKEQGEEEEEVERQFVRRLGTAKGAQMTKAGGEIS